jgi:uncharacterized hydrophobic protein (TIGR00271 family)
VLHLRVYGAASAMEDVARSVSALPGADHVTRMGDASGRAVVTADLDPEAVDPALGALRRLGIPPADVWVLRLEGIQPGRRRRRANAVVWVDLIGQASEYARPFARFLIFMAVAGIVAGYGVIYGNGILVVGAMAVSPDFLPIAATCIALVAGSHRLAARAIVTLVAGLGLAGLAAGVLTALLDVVGLLPNGFVLGEGPLAGLTSVNSSTFVVAFAAGIAGLLAVETRASAAVGVAISVTTIPASAYLGVAAGEGEIGKALSALAVLAINVAMLLTGGTLTLVVQRALARRAAERGVTSGS